MKNAVFMEHWTKQCKFSFCYAQSLKGVIITLSRFYINVCLFWSNVEQQNLLFKFWAWTTDIAME